jgi:hypothetical protein
VKAAEQEFAHGGDRDLWKARRRATLQRQRSRQRIFKFASDPIWLGANSKVVKIQEFPRIAASRSEATELPAQRKTSALGVATERIVLQNLACFLSNPLCCPNVGACVVRARLRRNATPILSPRRHRTVARAFKLLRRRYRLEANYPLRYRQ